jgi:hypothetical protein
MVYQGGPSKNSIEDGCSEGRHQNQGDAILADEMAPRLPPTTVRMNHERLPRHCAVDDVTRPNMVYTEHSLVILSHIVLAKFAFERNILIAIDFPCKLIVLNRVT